MSRRKLSRSGLRRPEAGLPWLALAAGITHELNNPAAALGRTIDQLRDATSELERRALAMNLAVGATERAAQLEELRALVEQHAQTPTMLGSLEQADLQAPPMMVHLLRL